MFREKKKSVEFLYFSPLKYLDHHEKDINFECEF